MPQRARRQKSNTGLYHVFVRGINKERIFEQEREKQYLKKILRKYLKKYEQYDVEVHAYCIMSNHAHLIIKSNEREKVSYFMSNVLAEYAQYYNYKHNRNGHVFQNRFGSECIENEKYYWNCIKYIHMNPVKALLVPTALDYKYSSLVEYKRGTASIVHPDAYKIYKNRFASFENYLQFHNITNEQVFLGMHEEVYAQKIEVALQVLWELKEQEKLEDVIRIFEEPQFRKMYKERYGHKLQLSKTEIDKVYTDIERKFII